MTSVYGCGYGPATEAQLAAQDSPDVDEPAKKKAKKTRALDVLMVFDAEEPGEPDVYIMPFAKLRDSMKSWLQRNNVKYTPFHMIEEEDFERYREVVERVRKSKHAMKMEEWMMAHGDFKVVSSFSWAEN